jgi:hypothetical protein
VKRFEWSKEKNELLKLTRRISFDDFVTAYNKGKVVAVEGHKNKKKYPNQKIFIVELFDYIYLVPFVEDGGKIFLKTIIPSRKATKKYLKKGGKNL